MSDRHPAEEETTRQRFIDKVVITGSAEGMGRAIALAFAKEGAIVVPTDVNAKFLAKTAKEVSGLSGRPVDWFKMDVAKKDEIAQTVKAIIDKHGRIDEMLS
jgi:NAD(P)-dependent dehydrogenase (short-subunit alcohol dehydrogenase family)